jgi:hypothetical protein
MMEDGQAQAGADSAQPKRLELEITIAILELGCLLLMYLGS